MDYRQLVRSLAVGRVAVGLALVLVPSLAARGWAGDEASRPATKVFLRALGIPASLSTGRKQRKKAEKTILSKQQCC